MPHEDFDMFQYGQLVATVDALKEKIDKLESSVSQLVELANRSKGGFFAGMALVSFVSTIVGYISHNLFTK